MKKLTETVTPTTLAYVKGAMDSYIILVLPKPIQSQKQLFKLIIKSPV